MEVNTMAHVLDFNTVKKTYLTVTLADEKKTTLMIGTPTKRVMDNLLTLEDTFKNVSEDEIDNNVMDDLYQASAQIMSNNKTRTKITAEQLADLFDFEDIFLFFSAYMDYVSTIINSKN